ncbi:hypothetical protein [Kitasatospora sp. LaBMicrA B282]|uniref:hypothetical protein n=1 Tax=Kitasatospora sp. LaBMicrA B282 TaxID=3420949 RepID=UPI003D14DC73
MPPAADPLPVPPVEPLPLADGAGAPDGETGGPDGCPPPPVEPPVEPPAAPGLALLPPPAG